MTSIFYKFWCTPRKRIVNMLRTDSLAKQKYMEFCNKFLQSQLQYCWFRVWPMQHLLNSIKAVPEFTSAKRRTLTGWGESSPETNGVIRSDLLFGVIWHHLFQSINPHWHRISERFISLRNLRLIMQVVRCIVFHESEKLSHVCDSVASLI